MRPQRNAAENVLDCGIRCIRRGASMRPQRNAAENRRSGRWLSYPDAASMRPQRNAAENGIIYETTVAGRPELQ